VKKNGECDREIRPRSFFSNMGGREIDDQSATRKLLFGRFDRGSDSFSCLSDLLGGEAHDLKRRDLEGARHLHGLKRGKGIVMAGREDLHAGEFAELRPRIASALFQAGQEAFPRFIESARDLLRVIPLARPRPAHSIRVIAFDQREISLLNLLFSCI